jgi:hypothetical protein
MATESKSTADNNNNKNSSIDDQGIQIRKVFVPHRTKKVS